MSLYKPKTVYAASERNTLQQVDKFKYKVVVFASGGRRSDEANGWIAKDNAVLHELYRSMATKPQSRQFLNRSLLQSLPMILNLG